MTLQVYNRLTRQLEPFAPLDGKVVKLYVCGPTVYDSAHIGHAMSAIVFDVMRRYLEYQGFQVIHVMNFTDVDDKIINRAQVLGVDPLALAQRYIVEWIGQVQTLRLLPPHFSPRASQVIPKIIDLVSQLIAEGYAYAVDGDVFYRVRKFAQYGQLSGRDRATAVTGTRVAVDERKEAPADFALWKAAKPGEPAWDSPWGPGRPGWHIECSAMVLYYLGDQIDIHGGGDDLLFPHHENEIAQSEAVSGKRPFAKYWLHNGMLQLKGEKMSKSLGNLVTLTDFLDAHEPDVLRLLVLGSHYRKPLAYGDDVVVAAEQGLRRLRHGLRPSTDSVTTGKAVIALAAQVETTRAGFVAAMNDDFNTAGALGHLFDLVRALNSARDAGVGGETFAQAQATLHELAQVLGLSLTAVAESNLALAPLIQAMIDVRAQLRQAQQWGLADAIRNQLAAQGILLEDGPKGTTWRQA